MEDYTWKNLKDQITNTKAEIEKLEKEGKSVEGGNKEKILPLKNQVVIMEFLLVMDRSISGLYNI